MPTELAVIILNYRTPDLTIGCLGSLAGEAAPGIQVVIVDNASGDDSVPRIREAMAANGWSSWAQLIESPVNGGFAAGNNVGIRSVEAFAYLLLNSDTLVRPGVLRELMDALRAHPEAGAIGSGLLDADGKPERAAFRVISPITELLRGANLGPLTRLLHRFAVVPPPSDSPCEAEWVAFACVLVRAEAIRQIGLLDEGFFMYFEDVDYCRRIREARWKVLTWPKALVVHLSGGSSRVSSADAARRRAPRYFYEARARYFGKHYGRLGLWTANVLWHLGQLLAWLGILRGRAPARREREATDIWTKALDPLRTRS